MARRAPSDGVLDVYHTAIRARCSPLVGPYAAARAAIAAGTSVPLTLATTIKTTTEAAYDVPTPAGCP